MTDEQYDAICDAFSAARVTAMEAGQSFDFREDDRKAAGDADVAACSKFFEVLRAARRGAPDTI